MMSRIIFLIFLFSIARANHATAQNAIPDTLPANMVWLNSDFNPNMESLKQKVTIVMFSDPSCVECAYYATLIQDKILAISAFQFVEVYKADTAAPLSRGHLVNYIQQQGITHPVGVLGNLQGFHTMIEERCPYFMLYELSDVPSVSGFGPDGFSRLMRRMDELISEKTTLEKSMLFQFKTWMEPCWWANPVVETPSYMAVNEDDGILYLNDAAHHRILSFERDGQVRAMLSSMLPGYVDESMYSSQFYHPHGMEYFRNALYVADTYNHRLRKIDFETEQTTTLTGNGFVSWKRAKEIDGIHEPLGLPIDVVVLDDRLYVASAATNQLFEVDESSGAAELFCDLPQSEKTMVPLHPVNLNASKSEIFVTMSDGSALRIDRKGKVHPLTLPGGVKCVSVESWRDGICAVTMDGHIWFNTEDKWKLLGEYESEGVKKNQLKLSYPTDAKRMNDKLLITDTDNHFVRQLDQTSDRLFTNFWFKMSQALVGFEAANSSGELILMDTIFTGAGNIQMNVIMDLQGYQIVKAGQNEIVLTSVSELVKVKNETIRGDSFSLQVDSAYPDGDVYAELYLTLEHPENPGLYIVKRAYLDFPVLRDSQSETVQEQILNVNLLPH
ncbi:MAG: hypothetical protein ACKOZY_07090 [Flavobacteriales bacterium]